MLGEKVPESYRNLPRATLKRRGRPTNCIYGLGIKAFGQDPKVLIKGSYTNLRLSLSNRSFVQNERQSFLPCPEMVCPCGLGFSSGSSLPISAGLGFIDRRPSQNLRTKGAVCSKSVKKTRLEGNLCYLAFSKAIGLQKEEFRRDRTPDGRFQNHFLTAVAKVAA